MIYNIYLFIYQSTAQWCQS